MDGFQVVDQVNDKFISSTYYDEGINLKMIYRFKVILTIISDFKIFTIIWVKKILEWHTKLSF